MATVSSSTPVYTLPTGGTSGTSAATAAASTAATDSSSEVANRFLTLLVSQLQNQDPLNPLDNAQVTSQLAQLSTVNGINRLNETLSGLVASFGANQYLQAATLVGRDVLVPGSSIALSEGAAAGGFTLDSSADSVTVTITDASGQRVRQLELGSFGAGTQRFEWDGKSDAGVVLADGKYTMSVSGSIGGKSVQLDALTSGKVTGIAPGTNGAQLQVAGLGLIDLTTIKQIN